MSGIERKGSMRGTAAMSFETTGTISALQTRTGRYITADNLHHRVQAWAFSNLDAITLESEIEAELCSTAKLVQKALICHRGRQFDVGYIPQSMEMGPPPSTRTPHTPNRYNTEMSRAMYLCASEYAVRNEVPDRHGRELWIQDFLVPPSSLRIADLRISECSQLLNHAMWFAENAGEDGAAPLSFSQRIAELITRQFDGFVAPGVRGSPFKEYDNVVLLAHLHEWQSWLYPTAPKRAP